MKTRMTRSGIMPRAGRSLAYALIALLLIALSLTAAGFAQSGNRVTLAAGGGTPGASGVANIRIVSGAAEGELTVRNLPAQPFGSGRFYVAWYVSGGNKAFLGPLVSQENVIFANGGNGVLKFKATRFTDGAAAGSPITVGAAGTNTIIVLIENVINGMSPSPVGPVPGTGVAVVGTF